MTQRFVKYDLNQATSIAEKPLTPEEAQIIEQSNKIDQRLATVYVLATTSTGMLFVLAAIVRGLYSFDVYNQSVSNIFSFPFDISHPLVFGFLFILTSSALFIVSFASVSAEAFFAGLAGNLAAHFKCIHKRFEDRSFDENDGSLKELIDYHELVLDQSNRLMAAFRMIIFMDLLVASVLLCILCFQLVMFLGSSLLLIMAYLLYIVVIVIQVSFFSYFGSLLSHESTLVSDAIYCSNWYEASPKTRKMLLLCMMRSQLPVNINAGFMRASLPTLLAVSFESQQREFFNVLEYFRLSTRQGPPLLCFCHLPR
ncbi:odorant receptor 82a-like [Topomyia yanbarensis]|uniref:odorant receptor 82a-like n=1 Tax=Topomyia yanbarensis TaxID=2498891 RepID=UPI00273C91AA|nr:odorant receptor 82a-like [Topomyia yanbarensis]